MRGSMGELPVVGQMVSSFEYAVAIAGDGILLAQAAGIFHQAGLLNRLFQQSARRPAETDFSSNQSAFRS